MATKVLKILLIGISIGFVISANSVNQTRDIIKSKYLIFHRQYNMQNNHNDDDITLPQLSTLQKFQYFGRAYIIPERERFSDFYENYTNATPTEKNITSKNYPNEYPSGITENIPINVEKSTGIEIIVHVLDIDPKNDYLKISTVSDILDHNSKQLVLTGKLKEPLFLRALGITKLLITFVAGTKDQSQIYKGFLITYKPFGEIPPPVTNPPDVTIPFDDLETISKLIIIEEPNQINSTWANIKTILCNATNSFINSTKGIYLEPCYPNNVTLTKVLKCPKHWPNSLTCIDINFAITLFRETSHMTTLDPFLEDAMPKIPGGLFYKHLQNMWNEYGKRYMNAAGYPEYNINNTGTELWLWGGIGLGVLLVCFIILLVLLKTGTLQRKWDSVEEEDIEVTKENEIDITMYPSPDQIVPVLFPGNIRNSYNHQHIESTNARSPGIRVRTFSENSDIIEENEKSEYEGTSNRGYIDDDEHLETNSCVQVSGVNKDEAHT